MTLALASHTCTDQDFSAEYARGPLCRHLGFCFCAARSSLGLCPENSSHFGLPRLSVSSVQLKGSSRNHQHAPSPASKSGNSLKMSQRGQFACFWSLRGHSFLLSCPVPHKPLAKIVYLSFLFCLFKRAHEFGWTPGVGDGQGGPACCNSWDHKESDTTKWLNWTELNWRRI